MIALPIRRTLRLAYRAPFDWLAFLSFLTPRTIRGVETLEAGVYGRGVRTRGGVATMRAADDPEAGALVVEIRTSDPDAFPELSLRLNRFFDLDADSALIAETLSADPLLAPIILSRPGRRVPGAMDGLEMMVRAILGQQVSVAGARTLAGRIAATWGDALDQEGLAFLFPKAAILSDAQLESVGVMPARARAIRAVATALRDDPDLLSPDRPLQETKARLLALPGIGPWTTEYVALRSLRDPDAFPSSDLGLLKAVSQDGTRITPRALAERAESWRPWRAYAALYLWSN